MKRYIYRPTKRTRVFPRLFILSRQFLSVDHRDFHSYLARSPYLNVNDLLSMTFPRNIDLTTATIQELQDDLAKGKVTSVQLVEEYLVSHICRRVEESP